MALDLIDRLAAGARVAVAAIALAGWAGTALAAADAPLSGQVTLWGGANLTSAAQIVLEGFTAKNPGVALSYEKFPFAEYPTKMRLQLSTGADTPDVMIVHDFLVDSFIKAGWLADLSSVISPDAFLAGSLGNVTADGKIYGIPGQSNPTGLWYRADVFKQLGIAAPTTFEDYTAAAQKLKDAGYFIDAFDPSAAATPFQLYLYHAGGAIFNADGSIGLGDKAVAALTTLRDMVDKGYFFSATPNQADYWSAVNGGKIVARFAASSDAAYLDTNLDPKGAGGYGNWVYADPPQFDGAAKTYLYDQSFIVVNAKSKNLPAAIAVAQYLTTNTDAALVYDSIERPGIVVRQTPTALEALKAVEGGATGWAVYGGERVNATKAKLLLAAPPGTVHKDSRWNAATDAINLILPQVFSGALSPQDAVAQMTEQLQSIQ
ncbi:MULTISPECIES: extracellular solute-binding protein [unclassified Devosia]|uniref:ABC transporter substrate-binding protein n=1 Tax=unclassified Devosia TaxID=196773 RepID=UPI001ACE4773|nr:MULTISPECIES: extracellular solute-binding protein [unclassified Devosia]MBN9307501.1 extracellular solute-binding protein [Devosia sp.]